MAHHNTVFAQLLKFVPRHEFETLANEHHSGRRFRKASRWSQFVAMTMAQLSGRTSLRDCHQEIASASSFSFCMLAEFDQALEQGASAYRYLHWEAGLIGQAAYLEAERIGMRGTGIGCFFDDSVHLTLGIDDTQWQSLYHFTVGLPRVDPRLQTLPPYEHLGKEASP